MLRIQTMKEPSHRFKSKRIGSDLKFFNPTLRLFILVMKHDYCFIRSRKLLVCKIQNQDNVKELLGKIKQKVLSFKSLSQIEVTEIFF